jgi:SAM-dependent methyltransferase
VEQAEFRHPRLAGLYDAAFGWGPDDDYFLAIANRSEGATVLDLGCGTGRFTIAVARAGHRVTGVDPAAASLDVARAKPGAELVTWIEGSAQDIADLADLADAAFDRAFLTSHVAQFLVDDGAWRATLTALARVVVPGGTVTFDSRDPAARGWERWNPPRSERVVRLPDGTAARMWTEVTDLDAATTTVRFIHHYAFEDGEVLHSSAALRFRSEHELRSSLHDAGFAVEQVDGGWHGEPVGAGPDLELLVTARRRGG